MDMVGPDPRIVSARGVGWIAEPDTLAHAFTRSSCINLCVMGPLSVLPSTDHPSLFRGIWKGERMMTIRLLDEVNYLILIQGKKA